jgi:hypothetical protein
MYGKQRKLKKFQILIGRLATPISIILRDGENEFQILIGRLATGLTC